MKPTILVVEDEAVNVDLLVSLMSEKYELKIAYNGVQALKVLEKVAVDLILLDINMPKMNGFEVADALQGNSKLQSIPVIFLTGEDDAETLKRAVDVGAKGYLTKPFNKTLLFESLERNLAL